MDSMRRRARRREPAAAAVVAEWLARGISSVLSPGDTNLHRTTTPRRHGTRHATREDRHQACEQISRAQAVNKNVYREYRKQQYSFSPLGVRKSRMTAAVGQGSSVLSTAIFCCTFIECHLPLQTYTEPVVAICLRQFCRHLKSYYSK